MFHLKGNRYCVFEQERCVVDLGISMNDEIISTQGPLTSFLEHFHLLVSGP